jgi:hypothetical protein
MSGNKQETNAAMDTAVQNRLAEITRSPTEFLSFCGQVIAQAQRAGVTEQQILDQIPTWYQQGRQEQNSSSR